ncbi:MAG: DUF1585 domain-containing protein [Myxococcaceae bacterium]|jgi:hypothetical protein|nr:DUF1585 domain-containing protein [Myxococcaceae bacterium]MCA3016156.1 DUF1585 domain-containing protein [Myxococcaceae bacterium]
MRVSSRLVGACALALTLSALADGPVCEAPTASAVPLERRVRQVYLDLLGRPPTLTEYRFYQAKGDLLDDDLVALMESEGFYARMRGYHRGLLRANISQSVFVNGDLRLGDVPVGFRPLGLRGNPSAPLRGQNGSGCDAFVMQDECATSREDPHLEPTTKRCRDAFGVPLPVSVDYNPDQYRCEPFATTVSDCAAAVGRADTSGRTLPRKHLLFCDMRRVGTALRPHYCLPNPAAPQTAALTNEVLDDAGEFVVAFVNPAPQPGQLARLGRCSLDLALAGGVRGRYQVPQGCIQREGVVLTDPPYWQPANWPRQPMCAIEAQARDTNPWTMESCTTARFSSDRTCGCGGRSNRCEPANTALHAARVAAFNDEPVLIADSVLRRNERYFTLLTTRRSFVNGPLSQLYRQNQSPQSWQVTPPTARDAIPDVPLEERSRWVEYTRDAHASGVLTTPAWLYRFPTQRARVSHFFEAFLCKHFSPEPGAVAPAPEDDCNRENNLARRCGCSYCHAAIEPMGAHWGRFGERTATYLDPEQFPRFDARCRDCALGGDTACNGECSNYVMQAFDGDGAASLGLLRTYLYRTPDEEVNVAQGPARLVQRFMQTGDLEACAVRNLWSHLLGRPMTAQEEALSLAPLARAFAASNHDLKALVRAIVTTEAYRRVD